MSRRRAKPAVVGTAKPAVATATAESWPDLLTRARQQLTQLGLDLPLQDVVHDFRRALERSRAGRPIRLVPMAVAASDAGVLCGLYLGASTTDFVFFAITPSALHMVHNQVHELAHLMFGHGRVAAGLDRQAEAEAEAVATVLLGRWGDHAPVRMSSILQRDDRRLEQLLM